MDNEDKGFWTFIFVIIGLCAFAIIFGIGSHILAKWWQYKAFVLLIENSSDVANNIVDIFKK